MNRSAPPTSALRLPATVVVLGLVSLFNDIASEMVVPLMPILLATTLGAGPIALGVIEGVADAVASFLKLWSGRMSDRLGGRRKGLALSGYTLSNLARPLIALAATWPIVLVLRGVDRVGKGLRSAPRDALIADSTPAPIMGYAFGYHRALDNAGAVGGALVGAAVLAWVVNSPADVILWSFVPGTLAVLLLAFGVRERRHKPAAMAAPPPRAPWHTLSPSLRRYLMIVMLFTVGRASETFIVLRAHQLGLNAVHALLLWAGLNAAKAAVSTWGGQRADRHGRRVVLLVSWIAYSVCFVGFGLVTQAAGLWGVAIVYGLFAGASEGAERAQISDYAGARERGTAFGWYYLMAGIAAIPGGVLFGLVWHYRNAATAFTLAASLMALAVMLLLSARPTSVPANGAS